MSPRIISYHITKFYSKDKGWSNRSNVGGIRFLLSSVSATICPKLPWDEGGRNDRGGRGREIDTAVSRSRETLEEPEEDHLHTPYVSTVSYNHIDSSRLLTTIISASYPYESTRLGWYDCMRSSFTPDEILDNCIYICVLNPWVLRVRGWVLPEKVGYRTLRQDKFKSGTWVLDRKSRSIPIYT